jgi:hypothetical protein
MILRCISVQDLSESFFRRFFGDDFSGLRFHVFSGNPDDGRRAVFRNAGRDHQVFEEFLSKQKQININLLLSDF